MTEILTLPGYITDFTDRGAKNRWLHGENVRFDDALPQKLEGRQRRSTDTFLGVCRNLIDFKSLDLDLYLALATHIRFYIYDNEMVNITPLRVPSATLTDPFDTTAASSLVNVEDTAHGVLEGDYVTFTGATASPIDATLITGDYVVVAVVDANNYTIDIGTPVITSEAAFGGTVTYFYEISPGLADATPGNGYGTGPWDAETYGTPRSGSSFNLPIRCITIDRWGEDVLFNIRSGPIYLFDTSGGISTANRAALITQAPDTAEAIIVSPEDRHLIALGAHNGLDDDPMLVAWCSQEDLTDWVPTAINTAGDQRLSDGTRIITGVYGNGEIAILTDTALYRMVYVGYPAIFSIKRKASKCGAISPRCAVEYNGTVYWMGNNRQFYKYDGVVSALTCEIRDYVFDALTEAQSDKIYAVLNTQYSEVWWLIPFEDAIEISFAVVYSIKGDYFFFTTMDNWATPRTAMIDTGEYSRQPISAGLDGYLWDHGIGYDDGDTIMTSLLVRAYDETGDGSRFTGTNTFIPDFKVINGSIEVSLKGKRYPQDVQEFIKGPYLFTSTTTHKNMRMRARQIGMEIRSTAANVYWEYGTLRVSTFEKGAN